METCDEVWLLGENWQSGLRTDPKIIRPKVYSSSEKKLLTSVISLPSEIISEGVGMNCELPIQ